MTDDLLIVCPMTLEAKGLAGVAQAPIAVSGPGPAAMRRWFDSVTTAPRLAVLAGVAGALSPSVVVGSASMVCEVVAPDGRVWRSPVSAPGSGWRLAGVDHLVTTASDKRALAERTGADVVDMESHVFAAEAERRAWRWCVVRGVSDTADEALPPEIESLVDHRGRPRPLAAAALLARKPHLLGTLRELGRRTESAMAQVRAIVARIATDADIGARR